MKRDFKKLLLNDDFRRLGENFLSLSALNIINYVFPLLLIPYLTRVLGVDNFGIYSFAFAIIGYFAMVVKYGFEFSATKQVSIIRDDAEKLSRLFSAVFFVRIILVLIALVLLILLVSLVPKFSAEKLLFLSGFGIILGMGLIPVWFFQGMENMKYLTILNFTVRLIATVSVFVFVKEPDDYVLAFFFQSIGYVVGGILSLILVFRIFKIRFTIPTFNEMIFQLKDGWHLFLSTIGMNFYRESNVLILGFLAGYNYVGYYSAAEKIIKAVQGLTMPITDALFPFFGRKLNLKQSAENCKLLFLKVGKYLALIFVFLSLAILVLSPWGIKVYLGSEFIKSIINVQILSSIVLVGGLNYYFGIVGLVNMNKEKEFSRSVWVAGLISVFLSVFLVDAYNDIGASIAMSVAELILLVQIMIYTFKTKAQK